MNTTRFFLARAVLLSAVSLAFTNASLAADDYPSRPIRLIVPYAPGGGTDTVARMLGEKLSERLGQRILVENKAGAATQLGTSTVVKAAPDGYTLLMGTANLATNVPLFAKLPYDASKDLAPVSLVTKVPVYLFVNSDSPVKSVNDLLTAAKVKQGGLSYGTAGAGSVPHLAGVMFQTTTEADLLHIAYKGSSEATTAILSQQTDALFDNLPATNTFLKANRLRALAVAMPERSSLLPDVPTMKELGYPIEAYSWWGVLAPAGTPTPIIERLNREIIAILDESAMRERFKNQGIEPVGSSSDAFATHIRAETDKWSKAVKAAGLKPQ